MNNVFSIIFYYICCRLSVRPTLLQIELAKFPVVSCGSLKVMRQIQWRRSWLAIGLIFALTIVLGLAQPSPAASVGKRLQATAAISGPGITGTLYLQELRSGVVAVQIAVKGDPATLKPGNHGVHFHETGSCDATTTAPFSTAKGHFDPGPSGNSNPVEANHPFHLGDLPNLEVNAKGEGRLITVTSRVALTAGPTSVFDTDGTAMIIHANPDLEKAGGSGAEAGGGRLACGVVQPK
jgi:superoxide dismutase, Cu-Zn family